MKYLAAIVVLCALSNLCIVAGMDFDLEPTPLAYKPFVMRHQQQVRDTCAIFCNFLDYDISTQLDSISSISDECAASLTAASSTLSAYSTFSSSGNGPCSTMSPDASFIMSISGVACPDGYSITDVKSARATLATIQHSKVELTATPHSSVY